MRASESPSAKNAQWDDPRRLIFATDFFMNTHTLEFYTAALKCLWGAWNLGWWLYPGQDIALIPAFHVLHQAAPQWAWGLIGIFIGSCHLLTPIRHLRLRMIWLFLALMFWSSIALMIFVAIPYNTGVPMYGSMALIVGVCYCRLYLVHGELFTLQTFIRPLIAWVHWRR